MNWSRRGWETAASIAFLMAFWLLVSMAVMYFLTERGIDCFFCVETLFEGMKAMMYVIYAFMAVCVLSGAWDNR